MSHSLCRQFLHVIIGTKNLKPIFKEEIRSPLFAYITGIIKNLGGYLLARAGTKDHVHLLINVPIDISISDLLRKLKSCSSKWIRQKCSKNFSEFENFEWEAGFSAYSVSSESIPTVKEYFANEDSRHSSQSFINEMSGFIKFHEIDIPQNHILNNTFTKIFYHLVWTVKNREALLSQSLKPILHAKIEEEAKKYNSSIYAIGNFYDHIHVLLECSPIISTSKLVQNIKSSSSQLINKMQNSTMGRFSWQEGFGVFSVGKPALKTTIQYILNQEEHHKYHSYEDEWKKILAGNYHHSQ